MLRSVTISRDEVEAIGGLLGSGKGLRKTLRMIGPSLKGRSLFSTVLFLSPEVAF